MNPKTMTGPVGPDDPADTVTGTGAAGPATYHVDTVTADPLMTMDAAAALTGRNPEVIRRWIREGRLPAARRRGEQGHPAGVLFVRLSDLARVSSERPRQVVRAGGLTWVWPDGRPKSPNRPPRPPLEGWSRTAPACIVCGTTERPHAGRGMCRRCYFRKWRHAHGRGTEAPKVAADAG